jgi:hypothetical protein
MATNLAHVSRNDRTIPRAGAALLVAAFFVLGTIVTLVGTPLLLDGGNQAPRLVANAESVDGSKPSQAELSAVTSVEGCIAQQRAAFRGTAGIDANANMINVVDRTLGPTTMDLTKFCTETAALAPDPTGDLAAKYYVDNGHVRALYFGLTRIPKGDGGVRYELSPTPLAPEDAASALAAQRASK